MSKTYTVMESIEALDVDPKTFRRWILKADINLDAQRSKMDERVRFLTEEQIQQLATDHGRPWPPQPRSSAEAAQPIIPASAYKLLVDRVGALERHTDAQYELIEEYKGRLNETNTRAAAHGDTLNELADAWSRQRNALDGQIANLEHQLADQAAQIANLLQQMQAANRPRTARKQQADQDSQDGISELPAGLVGASEFAAIHGINIGTAKSAYQAGRIATHRGKWRGLGRNPITVAFDEEGRKQFYELYSGHHDFRTCQDCPH